jgi:hypothetical protein
MKEKQMELKKVRLEPLLATTLVMYWVLAASVQADMIESKPKPVPDECSSAVQFSKIRPLPKLKVDLPLYQPRPFPIQTSYPELARKGRDLHRMPSEFSRPEYRIKIDFSNMSSVMRLIYSLARWGTLAPVNDTR